MCGKLTKGRQQNTLIAPNYSKNAAFFNVRLVVSTSRKPIDDAVKIFQKMLNILQDADSTVILTWLQGGDKS